VFSGIASCSTHTVNFSPADRCVDVIFVLVDLLASVLFRRVLSLLVSVRVMVGRALVEEARRYDVRVDIVFAFVEADLDREDKADVADVASLVVVVFVCFFSVFSKGVTAAMARRAEALVARTKPRTVAGVVCTVGESGRCRRIDAIGTVVDPADTTGLARTVVSADPRRRPDAVRVLGGVSCDTRDFLGHDEVDALCSPPANDIVGVDVACPVSLLVTTIDEAEGRLDDPDTLDPDNELSELIFSAILDFLDLIVLVSVVDLLLVNEIFESFFASVFVEE
jgi:hypothetical protein